jgi:hypothetical protein
MKKNIKEDGSVTKVTLIEDPDTKELILPFTPELLDQLGWKEGDTLSWQDNKDGSWTLTKKKPKESKDSGQD